MNLADIKQRPVAQQSNIGPRASIIPGRRDTRAPDLEVNASLRTARRGTGSADELMRALGMVQKVGAELADYATAKHADDEQDNIARGFADQAAGVVDPEMEERSLGYRNAVTRGRVVNEFRTGLQKFEDEELRGLIERQDDPDIKVRQTEVAERLESFYRDFSVDPETGEVKRSLQSPGALRYLAESIQSSRAAVTANARARIEQRFENESATHFNDAFVAEAVAPNGVPDLHMLRTLVPPTMTDERFTDLTLAALKNASAQLKAEGRFTDAMRLIGSVRGYVNKPIETGVGDAQASGVAVQPTEGAPQVSGKVSFNQLAAAVMQRESRGDPNAVSPKGAVGTMQTMPGTLVDPGYGVKPAANRSPAELERVGRDYLAAMMKEYDGDLVLALSAYNAGPARANSWKARFAGKSLAEKIALIPFKETREYVRSILGNLNVTDGGGAGAPTGNPMFRLTRPGDDPITQFERSGQLMVIPGLDQVKFNPAQRAQLNQFYDTESNDLRRAYNAKLEEDQSHNALKFIGGVHGLGPKPTMADLETAFRNGQISPDGLMTVYRAMDAKEEQRQNELDRAASRADAAEARNDRRVANSIAGDILGPYLRGEETEGQMSTRLLQRVKELGGRPEVALGVLSMVNTGASARAKGLLSTDTTKTALRGFDEMENQLPYQMAGMRILPSQQNTVKQSLKAAIDLAKSQYVQDISDGVPHEEAYRRSQKSIATAQVALEQRYGVKTSR